MNFLASEPPAVLRTRPGVARASSWRVWDLVPGGRFRRGTRDRPPRAALMGLGLAGLGFTEYDKCERIILPHCGHWVMIERPAEFVAVTNAFFSRESFAAN